MTKYQLSAIIGMYRMGNPDAVIAMAVGVSIKEVFWAIKVFKHIEGN